jgi:hypothetical protein
LGETRHCKTSPRVDNDEGSQSSQFTQPMEDNDTLLNACCSLELTESCCIVLQEGKGIPLGEPNTTGHAIDYGCILYVNTLNVNTYSDKYEAYPKF